MDCCLQAIHGFAKKTFTSTTFNELLYRLLTACFMTIGIVGIVFLQPFLPIIILIALVSLSEAVEKSLNIPHFTVISIATVILWVPLSMTKNVVQNSIEFIVNPQQIELLSVNVLPLLVACYSGALVTVSDIWKVELDIGALCALIPTFVEITLFTAVYATTGTPFIWCLLTAACVSVWSHRFIQKRAQHMEVFGVGLRHDIPHLMRSSLLLNLTTCSIVATFIGHFVYPCHTSFSRENGNWTAIKDNCKASYIGAEDGPSALYVLGTFGASLVCAVVLSVILFFFGRHTGIPKTQILSTAVISSIAVFMQATVPAEAFQQVGDTMESVVNKLHVLYGCETLSCFIISAALVYGWRKHHISHTAVYENAANNVKQARNNIKTILYATSVTLHCFIAYLIFIYCFSPNSVFLEAVQQHIANDSIKFPKDYLLSLRSKRKTFIIVTIVATLVAAVGKAMTVVAILKWKYRAPTKPSLYFGVSTMAKGGLTGMLSCFVLFARLTTSTWMKTDNDGSFELINPTQLFHTMNILMAMVIVNVTVNPLAAVLTALLSRGWVAKRRGLDVELN